jgi:hypothetical protein
MDKKKQSRKTAAVPCYILGIGVFIDMSWMPMIK